jgi:hypothetical protein
MLKGMRMFGNKSKSRTLVAILVVASMSACTKDAALEPVVLVMSRGADPKSATSRLARENGA